MSVAMPLKCRPRSTGCRPFCGPCLSRESAVILIATLSGPRRWGNFRARDDGLRPLFHFAPGEQNPPVARQALQADVRAQAHDAPFVTAAGVRFPQTQDI